MRSASGLISVGSNVGTVVSRAAVPDFERVGGVDGGRHDCFETATTTKAVSNSRTSSENGPPLEDIAAEVHRMRPRRETIGLKYGEKKWEDRDNRAKKDRRQKETIPRGQKR